MDKGKKYLIVYYDGDRTRAKNLKFLRKDFPFFVFFNNFTKKEEMIHQDKIIRIEVVSGDKYENK